MSQAVGTFAAGLRRQFRLVNKNMLLPFPSTQSLPFDELMRPHLDHLYRLAYRSTRSVTDAEDLIQDLLIKLYPRADELRCIEKLQPWLARVLYRMFIDNIRRQSRSPIELASELNDPHVNEIDFEYIDSYNGNPEDRTSRNKELHLLAKKIDQLSEEHRIVIMLHEVEGYTLDEMHGILDCPVGTLKSRLHRARIRLRTLLNEGTF
jgi:RNA polymerase sigma factor (sigma-70 family)